MIHGKKRNGDLFKRLTENWGYTKPKTTEEEMIPLDEEMAAETDADVVEEEEEVQAEGAYKRADEELDEIEARDTPRKTNGRRPENAMADRVREETEAAAGEEVVEEAEEEVVEEDTETDSLEETIRKVVKEAIKTIKAKK